MHLKGVGIDIVEIGRIDRMIVRYGNIFLDRVYTEKEKQLGSVRTKNSLFYAGRWAAKEAFYKALPLQCQKNSFWKSIEILVMDETKRPFISICSDTLSESLMNAEISGYHLSISHEKKYCIANVILE